MSYAYDIANRLPSLDNSTDSGHYVYGYTYDNDDNGNLTQDEHFQYAYDPENRLLSVTKLAGTPVGSS